MESLQEWIARFKAEQAAKSPEQREAEAAEYRAWLASLPVLPDRQGEVQVIFLKRKPRDEG